MDAPAAKSERSQKQEPYSLHLSYTNTEHRRVQRQHDLDLPGFSGPVSMKFAHERDAQGKPTEMLRLEIADISGKRQVLALSARPLLSVKLAHNAILAAYEYNVPQALLTDLHNQFQQAEQEGRDDLYTALKTLDEPIPRTISDRLFDTLSELATNPNKGKSAGMGFV